jgi:hypothetical protein
MNLAPWEIVGSDWLLHVPVRFNFDSLRPIGLSEDEPDETHQRDGGNPRIHIKLEHIGIEQRFLPCKLCMELNGKNAWSMVINHLPLHEHINLDIGILEPETLSVVFRFFDISRSDQVAIARFQQHSSPTASSIFLPRWTPEVDITDMRGLHVGQIALSLSWTQLRAEGSVISEITSTPEGDQLSPSRLKFKSRLMDVPGKVPLHIERCATMDELLAEYAEKLQSNSSTVRKTQFTSEAFIDLRFILTKLWRNVKSKLDPVRLIFGEVADSVHIYARHTTGIRDRFTYLVVEVLGEDEVLHAVKSRPLSSKVDSFIDLPFEGQRIRLTLIEEEQSSSMSPSKSRLSPSHYRSSPSRSGYACARNLGSVELSLTDMRKNQIVLNLGPPDASLKLKVDLPTALRMSWLEEILPLRSCVGGELEKFILEWMTKAPNTTYPLGLVNGLDGNVFTIFDFMHCVFPQNFDNEELFRQICSIMTLEYPEIHTMGLPWLIPSELANLKTCNKLQKSVLLFVAYTQRGRTILFLCEMKTSEIELLVVHNDRIFSPSRQSTWAIHETDVPVCRVLTVVLADNIFVNRSPTSLVDSLKTFNGEAKGSWLPLFGPNDQHFKNLLHDRLERMLTEPSILPVWLIWREFVQYE